MTSTERTKGERPERVIASIAVALGLVLPAGASAVLPKTPTEYGLQVRPYLIDWTGDGTAYLGGFAGHNSLKRPFPLGDFGRLRWTSSNRTQGYAYGADWLNNGEPDDAEGTFTPHKVNVHVFRPRNGVFTRLALNFGHKILVFSNQHDQWIGVS